MRYCKNCLDPSTRPNTIFDSNGICLACKNFHIDQDDYNEKERMLIMDQIINKYCSKKAGKFDCIIGVSGGKDSTRQAVWVRDKLKLNPLLVCCSYPPEQITELGAFNLSNLIELGFDVLISAPSPTTWKSVLKNSFFSGNYLRGPELALHSSLPQIAIRYGIKLIFWGENPATSWNDSKTKMSDPYDGNLLRNSNTLKNCNLDWMNDFISGEEKKIPYTYPTKKEFEQKNIQIIFLAWFWSDFSMSKNAKVSCSYGLDIRKDQPLNTGDLYGVMALDEDWVTLNQMIKYYKFGFGRATDYLNFEIRSKKISREDALIIVKKYDGTCAEKYIVNFCKYIDISTSHFWDEVSKNVNFDLFMLNNKKEGKKFIPKFKVGIGI